MKGILKFIYWICAVLPMMSFVSASDVIFFSDYVEDIEIVKDYYENMSLDYFKEDFDKVKSSQCVVQYFDEYVKVSPICFYYTDWLALDTDKVLDYLIDNIDWFDEIYQQDSYEFKYSPTQSHYVYSNLNKYNIYKWSLFEQMVLMYWQWKWKMLMIDYETFAELLLDRYSFYVVPTYLANRWPCSLQNYRIAAAKLNWYVLQPWESLNMNSLIKYNYGACKWASTESHMFYWGSCGSSTQLFRMSLIMPNLTVLERYNHSKWRALYYGNKIMWDDASMYENSQRFTVQNDFDVPIYFRVYEKDNISYLVWAVPQKVYNYVEIKKDVDGLRSSVFKKVFDNMWNLLDVFQFDSRYQSITYSKA